MSMDKRTHWLWVSLPLLLVRGVSSYMKVTEDALCGPGSRTPALLRLESTGGNSAALVEMRPGRRRTGCPLVVVAPAGHMLALRLVPRGETTSSQEGKTVRREDCSLQVVSPQSQPPVVLDLCNRSSLGRVLMMGVHPFRHTAVLTWSISEKAAASMQANAVLLTVVARGPKQCSKPGMVPCLSEGTTTLLCVSSVLACDGQVNCPVSGFDEDPALCPQTDVATSTDDQVDSQMRDSDSLAKALAHYGPWGYLMLGTLLCGALLMVCGLWECCCRGSKVDRRFPTPPTTALQAPTVYVISNPGGGTTTATAAPTEAATAPPNYEELDQPPDYQALFPADKDQPKKPPTQVC